MIADIIMLKHSEYSMGNIAWGCSGWDDNHGSMRQNLYYTYMYYVQKTINY